MKRYVLLLLLLATTAAFGITTEEVKFFESKIRPILAQKCYECHSATSAKIKGGLRLDTKETLLQGGDSGASIIPKNPDASLLIKAITYKSVDIQMPPKEQLPDNVVRDFETWIKMGAPDPRMGIVVGKSSSSASSHWAYQPLSKATPPNIKDSWIKNDVDKFILAKLQESKLTPSELAEKRELMRRVYFDLIGLPPTIDEVEAFVADKSPDAYERLVDRLLASPHYGERWARYWLDVARYADTSGTIQNNRENRYTYSYSYRDYVIKAFNDDKPYNDFVLEQLAADKYGRTNNLSALGFITLGRDANNNNNDIIDDRIDVITKAFLATTVTCARCHDHKFDPISAKDYYSLHSVLNSSYVPVDKPLIKPIVVTPDYVAYEKEKTRIEKEIEIFIDTRYATAMNSFVTNTAKWLYGMYVLETVEASDRQDYIRENTLNPRIIQKWGAAARTPINLTKRGVSKNAKAVRGTNPVFVPYANMFKVPTNEFASGYKTNVLAKMDEVNPFLAKYLRGVNSMQALAYAYQRAVIDARKFINATNIQQNGLVEFVQTIYKNGGPLDISRTDFQRFYANNQMTMRYENELSRERGRLVTLELTNKGAPVRAMALYDKPKPQDSYVFLKGDPNSRGPSVTRRFIEAFDQTPNNYTNGSGRMELAEDIISIPLTARVYVNRLWQAHMHEGFVKTPDDFGIQTEKPYHYDLMNWLAGYFLENGQSAKAVHKVIVMSSTYQQSSKSVARKAVVDPDNKTFWRMNVGSLDFEVLRDTFLTVAGSLDKTMGGPSVELLPINGNKYSSRRSVYGLIDRGRLPDVFTTFDFATPDMVTGKRYHTIVPKQALFLMNNSFSIDQIRAVAKQAGFLKGTHEQKVEYLYNSFFQRDPLPIEIALSRDFVLSNTTPNAKLSGWEKYIQVLLLSNEMMFVN